MSTFPVKSRNCTLREATDDAVEVIGLERKRTSFASFRYSYTEISSQGGTARVKSRKTSFEDGKHVSETFEGELDRAAYDEVVGHAQREFVAQAELLMRSFASLLPFPWTKRRDRD